MNACPSDKLGIICQQNKDSSITPKATHKWEIISLDISGLLPETKNFSNHILTVTDLFSKYVILVPIKNRHTKTVAQALLKQVIAHYSLPQEILTNQGGNFESKLSLDLRSLLGGHELKVTAYSPSRDSLNNLLRTFIKDNNLTEWDDSLPMIQTAINSHSLEPVEFTPYEVMFEGKTPISDHRFPEKQPCHSSDKFAQQYNHRLATLSEQLFSTQAKIYAIQALENSKFGGNPSFKVGDFVFVTSSDGHSKLFPQWDDGPCLVTNTDQFPIIEVNQGTIQNPEIQNWHYDQLEMCELDPATEYWRLLPPPGFLPQQEPAVTDTPSVRKTGYNATRKICSQPSLGESADATNSGVESLMPNIHKLDLE